MGWCKKIFTKLKPTPQPIKITCNTCKYAHPDRGCELNVLNAMTHIVRKHKCTCLDYEYYVK